MFKQIIKNISLIFVALLPSLIFIALVVILATISGDSEVYASFALLWFIFGASAGIYDFFDRRDMIDWKLKKEKVE